MEVQAAASTRIRYKHKSNKSNGKDPQAKLGVGFTCTCMLCWATFLKVQNFPKRIDSLYVNGCICDSIVSEPNVAVNVDQPDSLKQVAVVCSAD